jgi:esterase/lipase superfamily enzyme
MALYREVVGNLYSGPNGFGECISFDWPSKGYVLGYLPDRSEARRSAQDLATVIGELYDWLLVKQYAAAANPQDACRAKTSLIAHSMGNCVLENAMNYAWTQKNRPLLVSLLHEALMVAADVDNDLFKNGETVQSGDGEGISNLTYRVTALYSGRDAVLGASAGLKHFGKRRLGRSGLDRTYPLPDNVWDIDCSQLIKPEVDGISVHSSYFHTNQSNCYGLMRALLQGIDRSVLIARGLIPAALVKQQVVGSPQ